MQMTEADIKSYMRTWEEGTLEFIEEYIGLGGTSVSLYGRNPPTVTGTCNTNRSETWHPTGYGSTAALLDLANRWGSSTLKSWLATNVQFCVTWYPWWFEQFGKPPGEDSKLPGVCGTTADEIIENEWDGDTDIKRHHNAYGLLKAAVDTGIRALGAWSDSDVVDLCDLLYAWIAARVDELYERPRQYIRYGNDLDTLVAMVEAYEAVGETDKADNAYALLKKFFGIAFATKQAFHIEGADGTDWMDYNYGRMRWTPTGYDYPWPSGHYQFGHQAWYRGHCMVAMIHAMDLANDKGDSSFEAEVQDRFLAVSRWIDPTERINAPLAPVTSACVSFFHNSHIAGGFCDQSRGALLLQGLSENTLAEWAALGEGDYFYRFAALCTGTGKWKSDGGYYEEDFVDLGGTTHMRRHKSGEYQIYVQGLPGAETENWYACMDAMWRRADLLSDSTLKGIGRIALFHQLAYCNSTNKVRRIQDRLKTGIIRPASSVWKMSRAFHWAIQAGWMWRSDEVVV